MKMAISHSTFALTFSLLLEMEQVCLPYFGFTRKDLRVLQIKAKLSEMVIIVSYLPQKTATRC